MSTYIHCFLYESGRFFFQISISYNPHKSPYNPIHYYRGILKKIFTSHISTIGGGGGRWSSGKYVGTTCLRAAGSSPVPPAVWVFWRLIWRTESFDPSLQVFLREYIPVAAQTRSCLQGAHNFYWASIVHTILPPSHFPRPRQATKKKKEKKPRWVVKYSAIYVKSKNTFQLAQSIRYHNGKPMDCKYAVVQSNVTEVSEENGSILKSAARKRSR
jgi:hypothetical protein